MGDKITAICQALRELDRASNVFKKAEVGCCGISISQLHLLMLMSEREGQQTSLTDVATILGSDLSTVSRVVDGLVRQGLVNREVNNLNRRRLVLALTEEGSRLVDLINSNMRDYMEKVLALVPPERWDSILDSLKTLSTAMRFLKEGCCNE